MKYIKKGLFLLLVVIAVAGCGSTHPASEENEQEEESIRKGNELPTIGIALYSLQNQYTVSFASAASDYAKEKGIKLVIYNGNYDAATQTSQMEEMIQDKLDGIILNPQDAEKSSEGVDLAYEAGIPVISVNTKVENEHVTSHVGPDDLKAGEMIMQEAADYCSGKGNIVILEGPLGQSAQVERMQGIKNILKDNPDIHVISCKTANWSRLEARTVMKSWLEIFDRIDVVVAENDDMALGAVDAVKSTNKEIPIIGIDGFEDALQAVEDGEMLMTVYQDAKAQAQTAIDVMLDYLNGQEIDTVYRIPLEKITKDNVDSKRVSEK